MTLKRLEDLIKEEVEANLSARSDSPVPARGILAALGIDRDKEMKAMQREPEKLALEELAKPRKRKIRKLK